MEAETNPTKYCPGTGEATFQACGDVSDSSADCSAIKGRFMAYLTKSTKLEKFDLGWDHDTTVIAYTINKGKQMIFFFTFKAPGKVTLQTVDIGLPDSTPYRFYRQFDLQSPVDTPAIALKADCATGAGITAADYQVGGGEIR